MRCDLRGRPSNLSKHEQIFYYVVATRCEMDMNGFDSVFDQLLDQDAIQFLVDSLNDLGATQLADLFEAACMRLDNVGFFDDDSARVIDFVSDDQTEILEDIEEQVRKDDALWALDEKTGKFGSRY